MADGAHLLEISNAISSLKRECFGRGPARAKAYLNDDLLCVVLEGGFIDAERTLVNHGVHDAVRSFRIAFEEVTSTEMEGIVERALGRKVVDYMSQVLTHGDVQVEIFLLEPQGPFAHEKG